MINPGGVSGSKEPREDVQFKTIRKFSRRKVRIYYVSQHFFIAKRKKSSFMVDFVFYGLARPGLLVLSLKWVFDQFVS